MAPPLRILFPNAYYLDFGFSILDSGENSGGEFRFGLLGFRFWIFDFGCRKNSGRFPVGSNV